MAAIVHVIIFLASLAIVWFFAGVLVESVSRIARRNCHTGFFTAFFILGFLTSISEFSVALNSSLAGVPGVSAGNLIGASFVLLLLVVPLLAVLGRGIRLNKAVSPKILILLLLTIALPALLVLDGNVTRVEGILAMLAYATVAFALYRSREPIRACEPEGDEIARVRSLFVELGRILVGAVAIFAAAYFLVEQTVYFASFLNVPSSLIGLLLLSLGTNIPELVIAARAILSRKSDVAFGDYLGSAAMNTFAFGLLAATAGSFVVEASEFIIAAVLLASGLALLYRFARSGRVVTRREGMILLAFYLAFLAVQFYNLTTLTDIEVEQIESQEPSVYIEE